MNNKGHLPLKANPSRLRDVVVSSYEYNQTQRVKKNYETKEYVPNGRRKKNETKKSQGKKKLNDIYIYNYLVKSSKAMVTNMLTKLKRIMDGYRESFSIHHIRWIHHIRKYRTEATELKNT